MGSATVARSQGGRRTSAGMGRAVVRHRDPPDQDAGVPQREVERLDEVGERAHPAPMAPTERRGTHHREALVGGRPQLGDQLSVERASRRSERPVDVAVRMLSADPQQGRDLPDDHPGLLPRSSQRRPPVRSGRHQRHGSTDQRVRPAGERGRGRHRVLTKMAWTAAWFTKMTPGVQEECGIIARADDQRDLPAARRRASG